MAWPKGKPRNVQTPGASAPIAAPTPEEVAEVDAIEQAIADNALTPEKPAPAPVALDESLPDAESIDPRSIKHPVLSRQGWVCPI